MRKIGEERPSKFAASDGWEPRPGFARLLRVVLAVTPFIVGWLAIRLTQRFFFGADLGGIPGALVFLTQAIVVSVLAAGVAARLLQRWVPLVALLEMSLIFPDHAPSRFKMALRSSGVKKLVEAQGKFRLSNDVQTAAEQAVQLVTELARHDPLTRGHTERVRAYADVIGQQLGLSKTDLNGLRWGALLHDVGKLHVPVEILTKPGKPTSEEWEILRRHPAAAVELLAPLQDWLGEWLLAASDHHERWDGTGYPKGTAGRDISRAGRIVAVADAYDVITSRRSYKVPASAEEAREELVRSAGNHFDPVVVRAMLEAGLRRSGAATRFGWILEAPGVAQFIQVSSQAATTAAATTVAVAATVVPGIAPALPSTPPPQIAFADEGDVEAFNGQNQEIEVESPTTTIVVGTTAADPADSAPNNELPSAGETPESDDAETTSEPETTESSEPEQGGSVAVETPAGPISPTPAPSTGGGPGGVGTDSGSSSTTDASPTTPPATRATTTTRRQTTTTVRTTTPTTVAPTTTPPTTQPTTTTTRPVATAAASSPVCLQSILAGTTVASSCDLTNKNFVGLDIGGAHLAQLDFSGTTFRDSNLNGANFSGANLSGTTFIDGSAERATFVGVDLSNASMTSFSFAFADLSSSDLRGATLNAASLSSAGLRDVDFRGVTLIDMNFNDADLRGADFTGVALDDSEFIRSNLAGTILTNTTNTDTVYWASNGTPVGHLRASYLRTTCPGGTFGNQTCW